jgi:molecular chaperone GrpE
VIQMPDGRPRKDGLEDDETRDEPREDLLNKEKKRNEELMTRLKYMQADLENYRKRMDRELREAGDSVARGMLSRLLVVLDELDLAVAHAERGKGDGELREGIGMVRRNLKSALESAGLERIESVGRPFNPEVHEAVEKVQGNSPGEDMVVAEIRPGFTFRGQLLRPSMVKVELASKGAREEAKASE